MSSSSLSAMDIVLGSNITLTCTSSGSPPDTFTWMKDGVLVTRSTNFTTVTYTNTTAVFSTTYSISNISISDIGTYTCTVTNPIGSDNYTFTVDIRKSLCVCNAKQKHLGCKKVRGQSEATLQTGRRDQRFDMS